MLEKRFLYLENKFGKTKNNTNSKLDLKINIKQSSKSPTKKKVQENVKLKK